LITAAGPDSTNSTVTETFTLITTLLDPDAAPCAVPEPARGSDLVL
jgi:hypothetical protein